MKTQRGPVALKIVASRQSVRSGMRKKLAGPESPATRQAFRIDICSAAVNSLKEGSRSCAEITKPEKNRAVANVPAPNNISNRAVRCMVRVFYGKVDGWHRRY